MNRFHHTFSRFKFLRLLAYIWIPSVYFAVEGCVEPYEFLIKNVSPHLVVEASISDKSFAETLLYPSDGRFFTVKLTMTGDVTNSRPTHVNNAHVELFSDQGQSWVYSPSAAGTYTLMDSAFKAETGLGYKIRVSLPDEHVYESSWESMPALQVPEMGDVYFKEGTKQMYVNEAMEWKIREKQIVTTFVDVPSNTTGEAIHYRWTFTPMWIYRAAVIPPSDIVGTCWATDKNYLNTYALHEDRKGGYQKELFDVLTVRNPRIYDKLSVLITQHVIDAKYFAFWREMKERNEQSSIQDSPPYNLKTNLSCLTGDKPVSGYFGVAREQARRWWFVKEELTYAVENTAKADCLALEDIAPECENCLLYSFGEVTNIKPKWWIGN